LLETTKPYIVVEQVRDENGLPSYQRAAGSPAPAEAPPLLRPNPLRRERWVDMGEELYPGHQLLIRFNPNKRNLPQFADDASDEDKARAGLKRFVLAHRIHFSDGSPDSPWIDPDTDQPLPSPATDEFWEAISNDVLTVIMRHVADDQKKVTDSIDKNLSPSADTSPVSGSGSPSGSSGA
jgi:hypothetical protein